MQVSQMRILSFVRGERGEGWGGGGKMRCDASVNSLISLIRNFHRLPTVSASIVRVPNLERFVNPRFLFLFFLSPHDAPRLLGSKESRTRDS